MLKNKLLSAMGGAPANYIEDVFSTWLYTGNGATQTITNGIDLAGDGGLVWIKSRAGTYVREHYLYDTARGTILSLSTDTTGANVNNSPNGVTAFNSDGFTALGPLGAGLTASGTTYASWTFRKAPKFFDVVTYTGNGANRTIAHNLGSVPGAIIIKRTDTSDNWVVYHRSLGNDYELFLNLTVSRNYTNDFNFTDPTSTGFSVNGNDAVNANGGTYVAYLFAHDAGGFGLSGTDNVISCGSLTLTSGNVTSVSLGWEPQWLLVKKSSSTQSWQLFDNMRGFLYGFDGTNSRVLNPNTTAVEANLQASPLSDGFALDANNWGAGDYIYIAIRRGPMAVPTSGTSVFAPVQYTTSPEGFITGFPVDFGIAGNAAGTDKWYWQSRLQGAVLLNSASTAAEVGSGSAKFDMMNGYGTGFSTAYWAEGFRRAPGFFDEVCYTGTGVARTVAHNLTVVPEMMIVKSRGNTGQWVVYNKSLGGGTSPEDYVLLVNSTSAQVGPNVVYWNSTNPSSAEFTVGTNSNVNTSGNTYVAYLFASCPGVSKVGSYTGTGTTQQINCGFTAGARFIMVKSTSTTGDWIVVDTARGLVSGNDPTLALNSTAAEVTTNDWFDPYSAGFELSSVSGNLANTNGTSYIYLAIA